MSVTASAGTTFQISAGVPATFDVTGYDALTFTPVGEITNIGDFGPEWSVESHNDVSLRGTQKVKTSRDPGSISLDLALDTGNAGQILMKSAHNSTSLHAILVTTPEGDKYYAQGLVTSFSVSVSSQSDKKTASSNIDISTSATDVDWVESVAA